MVSPPEAAPRRKSRAWIVAAVGYLASAAALVWVYWGFDWKNELPKFARADWRWVAVAVAADVLVYCIQGWRWTLLLRPLRLVSWLRAVQAVFIGLLANEVLPLRTGEIVRGYVLSLWTRLPLAMALSSVAVERVLDGLILVAGLLLAGHLVALPELVQDISFTLTGVVLVAAALLGLAIIHKHRAQETMGERRWSRGLWHVVEGLRTMGRSRWFLASAGVSVIYLALQVLPIYAMLQAYQVKLSVGEAAVVLLVLRLGTVIPQAPSNVGGFQFFAVVGLMMFGVEKAEATTLATIMFLVVTIPLWVGGAIAAALAGVRITELHKRANSAVSKAHSRARLA